MLIKFRGNSSEQKTIQKLAPIQKLCFRNLGFRYYRVSRFRNWPVHQLADSETTGCPNSELADSKTGRFRNCMVGWGGGDVDTAGTGGVGWGGVKLPSMNRTLHPPSCVSARVILPFVCAGRSHRTFALGDETGYRRRGSFGTLDCKHSEGRQDFKKTPTIIHSAHLGAVMHIFIYTHTCTNAVRWSSGKKNM